MALNTKGKLEITDLDFDTIKTNLKTYMKGQSEFTDYDFEDKSAIRVWCNFFTQLTIDKRDMFNGYGTYTFPNSAIYSGEFKDGFFHGFGIYVLNDDTLRGNFQFGEFIMSCPIPPACAIDSE